MVRLYHSNHFKIMPENQQERLKITNWIVGFTDGEGCFSVSIIKNSTTKSGWQIFPEFVITQGERSLPAIEEVQKYFQCGKIYVNRRQDNHKENLHRYCVRAIKDLSEIIIPFFKENRLRTAKASDFEKFCKIVKQIQEQKHLSKVGMISIAKTIQKMNRKVPARFLESSETTR